MVARFLPVLRVAGGSTQMVGLKIVNKLFKRALKLLGSRKEGVLDR